MENNLPIAEFDALKSFIKNTGILSLKIPLNYACQNYYPVPYYQ